MWRLDISTLHLWYVQLFTKNSNSTILVWKITFSSLCETKRIRVSFLKQGLGLNFSSAKLYPNFPRVHLSGMMFFLRSEPFGWSAMSCSPSVGINHLCYSLTVWATPSLRPWYMYMSECPGLEYCWRPTTEAVTLVRSISISCWK